MDVLQQKLVTSQRQVESTHPAVITASIMQAAALVTMAAIELKDRNKADETEATAQMCQIAATARAIAIATLPKITAPK